MTITEERDGSSTILYFKEGDLTVKMWKSVATEIIEDVNGEEVHHKNVAHYNYSVIYKGIMSEILSEGYAEGLSSIIGGPEPHAGLDYHSGYLYRFTKLTYSGDPGFDKDQMDFMSIIYSSLVSSGRVPENLVASLVDEDLILYNACVALPKDVIETIDRIMAGKESHKIKMLL